MIPLPTENPIAMSQFATVTEAVTAAWLWTYENIPVAGDDEDADEARAMAAAEAAAIAYGEAYCDAHPERCPVLETEREAAMAAGVAQAVRDKDARYERYANYRHADYTPPPWLQAAMDKADAVAANPPDDDDD